MEGVRWEELSTQKTSPKASKNLFMSTTGDKMTGEEIKKTREGLGLTQEQLAPLVGVSVSTVSRVNCLVELKERHLKRLLVVLNTRLVTAQKEILAQSMSISQKLVLKGSGLDVLGNQHGLLRTKKEPDDQYRSRLLAHIRSQTKTHISTRRHPIEINCE
jgi:transcriptional regulator with XRE-family HTH domain